MLHQSKTMTDDKASELEIDELTTDKIIREDLESVMSSLLLSDGDIDIVRARFGLVSKEELSREEFCNKYDIGFDYVKQLEQKVCIELKKIIDTKDS